MAVGLANHRERTTSPLDLVDLPPLMDVTRGRPEVVVGMIDGPVVFDHPDLAHERVREVPGGRVGTCALASSVACAHGTFVAGILCGRRGSSAPAICPGCTLLVRPLFAETSQENGGMPSASPEELAAAVVESVDAGARLINLSVTLVPPSSGARRDLDNALDHAAKRGVLVVAAAGNQATLGSTTVTRHPWVIPVVACDGTGRPTRESNLGTSIGRRGLRAPGHQITSLGVQSQPLVLGGTSAAAPFVTGTLALLWSAFPAVRAVELKLALLQIAVSRRNSVVPPLMDAWTAYRALQRGRR